MNDSPLARTLLLALSIVIAAWLVGRGLAQFRIADRAVSVKGVAEREVKADVGFWPLRFTAADDDLDRAQRKMEADRHAVLRFLATHGLDSNQVEIQGLEVQDNAATPYGRESARTARYSVNLSVIARTDDPQRLRAASQRMGDLLAAGVVLSSGPFGGPTYLFTKLNDFKPAMLAEATANAKVAADQFARASRSHVGGMRRASQGVFEVLPRDPAPGISQESQITKVLRVVTTVEYYLR